MAFCVVVFGFHTLGIVVAELPGINVDSLAIRESGELDKGLDYIVPVEGDRGRTSLPDVNNVTNSSQSVARLRTTVGPEDVNARKDAVAIKTGSEHDYVIQPMNMKPADVQKEIREDEAEAKLEAERVVAEEIAAAAAPAAAATTSTATTITTTTIHLLATTVPHESHTSSIADHNHGMGNPHENSGSSTSAATSSSILIATTATPTTTTTTAAPTTTTSTTKTTTTTTTLATTTATVSTTILSTTASMEVLTSVTPPSATSRPTSKVEPNNSSAPFERVGASEGWPESPYVSQAHLDRLWEYLFNGYYKEVPPVPPYGGPLPVGVGINVVKFKHFNEVSGTMEVAINLRLCWADSRLSFDALEMFGKPWSHEGDKLPIRSSRVWTPDITVLNEVGSLQRLLAPDDSPLVLGDISFMNQTGVNVLWSHPLDVESKCDVDMTLYPFDSQICYIVVGSWASSRRQLVLVPQPFFEENTVHSPEFEVRSITFQVRQQYTKGSAETFTEVVYKIQLRRYPHYYMINYILPMEAMTLLTVATMWMSIGNAGPRVNSGTKLLLCVVSIMFITARSRPAVNGDIWMDRFQSHCLACSMAAVLESLFIDWLAAASRHVSWLPNPYVSDTLLRAGIAFMSTLLVFTDAYQVVHHSDDQQYQYLLQTFASLRFSSSRLLLFLLYLIIAGLLISSVCSVVWLFLPTPTPRMFTAKKEDDDSSQPIAWRRPSSGRLGEDARGLEMGLVKRLKSEGSQIKSRLSSKEQPIESTPPVDLPLAVTASEKTRLPLYSTLPSDDATLSRRREDQ